MAAAATRQAPADVRDLFLAVAEDRSADLRRRLQQANNAAIDLERLLCHPLCRCDKCSALLEQAQAGDGGVAASAATVYARDDDGRTPLHFAARWGHDASIRQARARGAWVCRLAPRAHAEGGGAACVRCPCLSELIKAGALVNERDARYRTPLHVACQYTSEASTIQLLLQAGADILAEDQDGAFRGCPPAGTAGPSLPA